MRKLVENNDCILIDSCAVLKDATVGFLKRLTPYLKEYNKKLVIPAGVINEVNRLVNNKNKKEYERNLERFNEVRPILNQMVKEGVVDIKKREGESEFVDNVLISNLIELAKDKKVVLITLDQKLASDILTRINKLSVVNKPVRVMYLMNGRNGDVADYIYE